MKFETFWYRYVAGRDPIDHAAALSIFSQPLPEEVTESYDMMDTMLALLDSYTTQRAYEELYELAEALKEHNPSIYGEAFHYLNEGLITYFCYRGDEEKVARLAEAFIGNPLRDYDMLLLALKKANFYGYSSLVGRWASTIYGEVNESPDLIGGAAFDLVILGSYLEFEKAYDRLREGKAFDWPYFNEQMASFDFEVDAIYHDLLEAGLTNKFEKASAFFTENQRRNLEYLQKMFMRYMHSRQVPFNVSGVIWDFFYAYWESPEEDIDEYEEEEEINEDEYFHLEPKGFYGFAEKQSGFILDYRINAAAILWGGTYVYDFLYAANLIPAEEHGQFQPVIQRAQKLFMKENYDALWEYSFVHQWGIPDSKSEPQVAEEQAAFARTFEWARGSSPFPKKEDDPEWQALQEEFREERTNWLDRIAPRSVPPTQPIRAEKKPGRNEKVDVKYADGTIKRGIKYKKVQRDVEAGKCEIIE